jgi:hypothetical protein
LCQSNVNFNGGVVACQPQKISKKDGKKSVKERGHWLSIGFPGPELPARFVAVSLSVFLKGEAANNGSHNKLYRIGWSTIPEGVV